MTPVKDAYAQEPLPVPKNQSRGFALRGKGYRVKLQDAAYLLYLRFFSAVERIVGPAVVPLFIYPLIRLDIFLRKRDYPQFVRLRNVLPQQFWRGVSSWDHYYGMIRNWHEMGAAVLAYPQWRSPGWHGRIQIKGTPPHALAEWGKRPVILTFLHTGSFALVHFWMRSQGVVAVSHIAGLPPMLENEHHLNMMAAGDRAYGLDGVPNVFRRWTGLREAIRFLVPGHALTMALDGGLRSEQFRRYDAGGFPILVRNGACRMAAQTNAIIMPVSARRTGCCRFELFFGKPVADELLLKEDFFAATQHLITELWQELKEHPADLNWTTLEALAPELVVDRISWP